MPILRILPRSPLGLILHVSILSVYLTKPRYAATKTNQTQTKWTLSMPRPMLHNRRLNKNVQTLYRPCQLHLLPPPPPLPLPPSSSSSFQGFSDTSAPVSAIPPDSNMAAGPSNLVLTVNRSWGIFSRSGSAVFDESFFDWFSDLVPNPNLNFADPNARYDPHTDRFFFSVAGIDESTTESYIFLSVSDDDDASGRWCMYRLDANPDPDRQDLLADQPSIGIGSDGVYVAANMLAFGSQDLRYSNLYMLDIEQFDQDCSNVVYYYFQELENPDGTRAASIRPAMMLDKPTEGPAYMLNAHVPLSDYPNGQRFTLWRVNGVGAGSFQAAITLSSEPVETFDYQAPTSNAPQPDTSAAIDTLDGRLINASYYDGRLFTAHTVDSISGDEGTSAVRSYTIEPRALTSSEVLSSTEFSGASGSGLYVLNAAIATQFNNDEIITFNTSSESQLPDARYRTRTDGEWDSSQVYKRGEGPSEVEEERWGDYPGAVRDPWGGMWVYNQIGPPSGEAWTTWAALVE